MGFLKLRMHLNPFSDPAYYAPPDLLVGWGAFPSFGISISPPRFWPPPQLCLANSHTETSGCWWSAAMTKTRHALHSSLCMLCISQVWLYRRGSVVFWFCSPACRCRFFLHHSFAAVKSFEVCGDCLLAVRSSARTFGYLWNRVLVWFLTWVPVPGYCF